MKDPYALLGVPRDASDAQIRYAYRQAMRRQGADAERAISTQEREDLRWAYDVLSDPRKRREYDGAPAGRTSPGAEPKTVRPVLSEAEKLPRNPLTRLTHRLPRPYRIALDWVLTIAGAVAIVLAIKAWVVNPYRIPSPSMEPTLHCARGSDPGCEARFSDRVLANRFIYHFRSPHRSEIVVFNTPPKAKRECGAGGTFVKRLIGLPGDRIRENDAGYFFINGKRFDDSGYIEPARRAADSHVGIWVVPPHSYFFVGDNRGQSCDSRVWGAVPRSNLIGPVFAIYWPPNRIHVDTPGLVGGVILGVLGGIVIVLVGLAVRRRRVR